MKAALSLLFAVSCLNVFGQTNFLPAPSEWFMVSQTQLRPLASDDGLETQESPNDEQFELSFESQPARTNQASVQQGITSSFTLEQNASANYDIDASLVRRLEAEGFFERKQPPPDNYFVRSVTTMFDAEPIHVGKTTVTCTIFTAIKKKNPLCLLNPIVLNISW